MKTYKETVEALHYTDAQKQRLARIVLDAAAAEKKPRRVPLRTALLAAGIAAALCVGAGATGALKTAVEAFGGFFGEETAQTEVIDRIGRPLNASDTVDGITITADAIMGDSRNICVVFSIFREDGTPLLPEGVDASQVYAVPIMDLGTGWGSSSTCLDSDPADASIQCITALTADEMLQDVTARVEFRGLGYCGENGEDQVLSKKTWKLKFELDYEDLSRSYGSGESCTLADRSVVIDDITLSPLAVTVNFSVPWENPAAEPTGAEAQAISRTFKAVTILLTLKDGTVLDFSSTGGSMTPREGVTCGTKGVVFDTTIPFEDMESLSVAGVVYEIE